MNTKQKHRVVYRMKGKRNVYDVKIEEEEVKKMKVDDKILVVKEEIGRAHV